MAPLDRESGHCTGRKPACQGLCLEPIHRAPLSTLTDTHRRVCSILCHTGTRTGSRSRREDWDTWKPGIGTGTF
ncbi:hypothetical protein CK820_G0026460 [Pan troglodytes]|uniref:Uncharacterized protein n=1 Tax=Pan troglodytes TaxID=9598 RepID=A0A2J8LVN4_PANTR|nr:hypothetical protein CK820_G0026460 [Pan troglodytes]